MERRSLKVDSSEIVSVSSGKAIITASLVSYYLQTTKTLSKYETIDRNQQSELKINHSSSLFLNPLLLFFNFLFFLKFSDLLLHQTTVLKH